MLVNTVKLRYGDTSAFLDIASVISQYSIENQVDGRYFWSPTKPPGDTQQAGGAVKYTDRPTITYSHLSGEKFARSLMRPIPPAGIWSLIQGGYPVDLVLMFCVHSVNGVRQMRWKGC